MRRWATTVSVALSSALLLVACASGDDGADTEGPGPAAGKAGTAGTAGKGGTAGTGGVAGKGGSAGAGAQGGAGGVAGKAGASGAGQGGAGGKAGTSGGAGASGEAGQGGQGGSACVPEICNGLDDDCDGQKDEDVAGAGEPCTVPNKQGECAFGTTQCTKGKLECSQKVGASVEVCDGKDNNCDGQIDNAPTDVGMACTTDLKGLCAQGTLKCVGGEVKCESNFQPTAESCNGFDDNCDGNVDEGFPGAGMPCSVPGKMGQCALGQTACQNSGNQCTPLNEPKSEVCNGVDDDCDGQIDEKDDVDGKPCDTEQLGECAKGTTLCDAGKPTCQPLAQPQAETCDGKDNDCDGMVDNISATKLKTECIKEFPSGQNIQEWKCDQGECVIGACSSTFLDCDNSPANGCEIDSSKDINNCGSCFGACPAINGTPTCIAKQCGIVCTAGFGDCDGQNGNGCEQSLAADPDNCGTCSKKCSDAGGSGVCNGGTCKTECNVGAGDCDGNATNGCETDTNTNPLHCGLCGKTCSAINATATCEGGLCKPKCKAGYGDCDGDPSNGCEVNLNTSTGNCGSCDNICTSTNGSASCSQGKCGLSCLPGYGDCDLDPGNGCETALSSSIVNCGGCGLACDVTNNTPACKLGVCTVKCTTGFQNCNSNVDDGCEVNTNTDINNCGGCGIKCGTDKGTATCDQGVCKIACNSGYANCDNLTTNGCEVNVTGDINNCGACGKQCSTSGGGASCNGGTCGISCTAPKADCNSNAVDGCEVDLSNSVANCGLCGNACNPVNASANICLGSKCIPACNAGFADCDGLGSNGCEANTTNSINNCGGCGLKCVPTNADGATCAASKCTFQCKSGFADCDNNPANGCETNIASDNNNCGSCGGKCVVSNGVGSCVNGSCSVIGCSPPSGDCDGNPSNGCETDTSSNVNNCGGCGTQCSTNHSSPLCTAGQCKVGMCQGGYGDCNNNAGDGCETNIASDANNCGQCGSVCTNKPNATSMKCAGSTCQVQSCAAGFFDVDSQGSNGCECKEDAVADSCGGATDLGTVTIGQTQSSSQNLTGFNGNDSDWFKVTFPNSFSCNHSPSIELSVGSQPIRMRVFTSCGGSGISCGVNEPANSAASDLLRWDFNLNKFCGEDTGDSSWAEPFPNDGTFLQVPTTLYIQVLRTGPNTTLSCLPYTLTVSNTLN